MLTLTSPLDALADGFLFSAHMFQHMLLLLIVPLLLLLGLRANETGASAEPGRRRFRLPPLLGWVGGVGAMWVWHERMLCDLATRTEAFRVAQIISLLALGALFWWPLVGPQNRATHLAAGRAWCYLFSACFACSVLGIVITFAPGGSVCPDLSSAAEPACAFLNLIRNDWELSMAKDQQLGGLLMWIPGCRNLSVRRRWRCSPAGIAPAKRTNPPRLNRRKRTAHGSWRLDVGTIAR